MMIFQTRNAFAQPVALTLEGQTVEGGGGWTRSGGEEQNVSDSRPALPTLKTKRDVPFTETRQTQGLEVETRLET